MYLCLYVQIWPPNGGDGGGLVYTKQLTPFVFQTAQQSEWDKSTPDPGDTDPTPDVPWQSRV